MSIQVIGYGFRVRHARRDWKRVGVYLGLVAFAVLGDWALYEFAVSLIRMWRGN